MFGFCEKGVRIGACLLRIVLGIIFIAHGGQKVGGLWGGPGLEATIQGFEQHLGLSAFTAILVSFGELLGGIALVFGFLTRLSGLGLFIIMAGALVTAHWKNGFFINWAMIPGKGHGYEYNLALMAMAASLFFSGGGYCSIDNIFQSMKDKRLEKHSYQERES
jgi:putative oxidoreductase